MIYDYYCIDCGKKFAGQEIRFDIAELIGLRGENDNEEDFAIKITLVDLKKLNEYAKKSGVQENLRHGQEYILKISLQEFLNLMAGNQGNSTAAETIEKDNYGDLKEILKKLYTGTATGEEQDEQIDKFISTINAHFSKKKIDDGQERKLTDFVASFRIKPEFFEDGNSDAIYTVKYNYDLNATNLRELGRGGVIRGYCPACGKIIVKGAGKYQHTLVGLLGAQRAGKTSTIVAMLEELRLNYSAIGISYPGVPLYDSRSKDRDENLKLYQEGWAVKKTVADNNTGSFNATLLIRSKNGEKEQIFTFVDIAGEQCYDKETKTVNMNALQVYPLINGCHIFLLCTGILPEEKKEDDNEEPIPPEAVLEISRGIYSNLREKQNVPPICIVATKADLAGKAVENHAKGSNPFAEIKCAEEYLYAREAQYFTTLYESATNEEVRRALKVCHSAYEELSQETYVSMISCWALGRKAESQGNNKGAYKDPDTGSEKPFTRERIDCLCKWIFQVSGILDVDGYRFSCIPSMGESYFLDDDEIDYGTNGRRKVYSVYEACDRIEAVKKVFINLPEKEDSLEAELQYVMNKNYWGFNKEKRKRKAILEALELLD